GASAPLGSSRRVLLRPCTSVRDIFPCRGTAGRRHPPRKTNGATRGPSRQALRTPTLYFVLRCFLKLNPMSPTSPAPSSKRVEGSGTVPSGLATQLRVHGPATLSPSTVPKDTHT